MLIRLMLVTAVVLGPSIARAQDESVELTELAYRSGDSPTGPDGMPLWATDTGKGEGWTALPARTRELGGTGTMAWIRVSTPDTTWHDPSVFVRQIDGAFEAYVRGRKVSSGGVIHPQEAAESGPTSWYIIPLEDADLGSPIYFRLQGAPRPTGFQNGLLLGNAIDHFSRVVRGGLPQCMVAAIMLLLGILSFFAWWRSREGYLLPFGGFTASASIVILGVSNLGPMLIDAPWLWARLLLIGAVMMGPFLCDFLSRAILERRRPGFTLFIRGLFVAGGMFSVLTIVNYQFVQSRTLLTAAFFIIGEGACVAVAAMEAWKGHADARLFLGGMGAVFLIAVYDTLGAIGVRAGDGYHMHWSMLLLTGSLAFILGRRYLMMRQQLEQHAREITARHRTASELSQKLSESTAVLVDSVARLRESSQLQENVVNQQSATLQEVVATAQEIMQASRLAAEKATAIMASSAQVDETNRSVGKAVDAGLNDVAAMGPEVAEMARRIQALEQRTRQIGGIVDTVKDLADQSNMLALNAAIEAVRSGEAGKGFTIVAREMRALADLSLQATARIRDVLVSTNDGIREAAELSERSAVRIQGSLKQFEASGSQLMTLTTVVQESTGNVRQISAAVGQQSAGVSQIFTALGMLSEQMNETMERLKETRRAAAAVEQVASTMSIALGESSEPSVPRALAA